MFHSTRIKLTAWYLAIITLISVTFSAVIYRGLMNEVERFDRMQRFRIERGLIEGGMFTPPRQVDVLIPTNSELVNETRRRIIIMLLVVNAVILFVSGVSGYFLAGRTLQPIKEMVDEQNRFISDASHELKTPLTSLKSAFEVYLRDDNRTQKEGEQIIRESIDEVNKLQRLSESLLTLAHYQQINGKIKKDKTDIDEVITEAVKKVLPISRKAKITITTSIVNKPVLGNKDELVQLIVILLDNAIKYSQSKSEIKLNAKPRVGMMEISVHDCGIGIETKDMLHIFDRFYRSNAARTRSGTGGYGLGLAIAKKIVESHHGTISVESIPRKGSTFIVRLPTASKSNNIQ